MRAVVGVTCRVRAAARLQIGLYTWCPGLYTCDVATARAVHGGERKGVNRA